MIHPDYQYTPMLIPAMVSIIGNGLHDCVLGSRILGGYALKGGMPLWKYVSNRFLTAAENILLGAKLSEYHTGYRAFSRKLLETLSLAENSDDFVFDNQMLAQIFWHGFTIGEVSCPTKYFAEASSINFRRSLKYGFGCLSTGLQYRLRQNGIAQFKALSQTLTARNVSSRLLQSIQLPGRVAISSGSRASGARSRSSRPCRKRSKPPGRLFARPLSCPRPGLAGISFPASAIANGSRGCGLCLRALFRMRSPADFVFGINSSVNNFEPVTLAEPTANVNGFATPFWHRLPAPILRSSSRRFR